MEVVFDWLGLLASFSATLNAKFPLAVGVPEMIPEVAANDSPVGSFPELTLQL